MPWKHESPMDQKLQLIGDWLKGDYSKSQLSRIYRVSRPTIDKWILRYQEWGLPGLEERSRAPHTQANKTTEDVIAQLIEMKLAYPHWGPKKLLVKLKAQHPEVHWPSASTASDWLKKEGLVRSRKARVHVARYSEPFQACGQANHVWSADYKGQFRTGDKQWCYPLTLTDNYSRYLLTCRALKNTQYRSAKGWIEWAFREYGLPEAIRTDNGAPFASIGLGGLSRLSVWLIKLGVRPERIEPGRPDQNGRHERMHRTLKEATANPPKKNFREQQNAFDAFKREYNDERPHEALDMKVPSAYYQASLRSYPEKLMDVEYSDDYEVRRIKHSGEIKWKGQILFINSALAKERVGLKQNEQGQWELYYSFYKLAHFDEKTSKWLA